MLCISHDLAVKGVSPAELREYSLKAMSCMRIAKRVSAAASCQTNAIHFGLKSLTIQEQLPWLAATA